MNPGTDALRSRRPILTLFATSILALSACTAGTDDAPQRAQSHANDKPPSTTAASASPPANRPPAPDSSDHLTSHTSVTPADATEQPTLVIIHPPALRDAALEWAEYRVQRGWLVARHEFAIERTGDDARQAVCDIIRSAHRAAPSTDADQFAVMLLGDDDAISSWPFEQTDPLLISDGDGERIYISDQPYQLADDENDVADFPLGRVPARSNDQARALLQKIREHEAAPPTGVDRRRVTYIAGEARFGPFDLLLEWLFVMMVDQFVPDAYELTMTYAKSSSIYCPPPSQLTQTVLTRMTEGAALFNYLGHGWSRGLDSLHWDGKRYPILRVNDLRELDDSAMKDRARPVAFMSCCSVGHFDLPEGDLCLSEAMLFHPSGPIAVISGSRVTHPYANTVLQKDITAAMLRGDGSATAGLLDLHAERSLIKQDAADRELDFIAQSIARSQKWQTSLRDLRKMHAKMYNLLGDPATALTLPAMAVKEIRVQDGVVSGRVEGMKDGSVTVEIETPRIEVAERAKLLPPVGDDDPDLEAKAQNNYPLANARLLLRAEGDLKDDGRFEIALPQDAAVLPPEAGLVRVRITGTDAVTGEQRDAIGALRLP
jgi:hypothetical protein